MLTDAQRARFDAALDRIVVELPNDLKALLDEVPLVVDDEPAPALLADMGLDARTSELCGLHWGVPLTDRSVQHTARLPGRMMLFRGPIHRVARNRHLPLDGQVRITLLHEIGHHFGLDEDQLRELGYA